MVIATLGRRAGCVFPGDHEGSISVSSSAAKNLGNHFHLSPSGRREGRQAAITAVAISANVHIPGTICSTVGSYWSVPNVFFYNGKSDGGAISSILTNWVDGFTELDDKREASYAYY